MRRRRMAAAAVLATLAVPGVASAGGWATVGLDPPPGDTARAGASSAVELTVLQHGRTPLQAVKPRVLVRPGGRGPAKVFAAQPTTRPGVYRARVVFPADGRWSYEVDDGFGGLHPFGDVRVSDRAVTASARPDAPAGDADLSPWLTVLAGAAMGVGIALAATRSRRRPAASHSG